jgi:hypothetical protein
MKPFPQEPIATIRECLDCEIVRRGRVVVIGLGGIGTHLVRPLSTFLASLVDDGSEPIDILLCDGDHYAAENLYRMDVAEFGNKAEAIGRELIDRPAGSRLTIRWVPEYATPQNVADLIQEGDCVFLACDNHATRNLIGRHCSSGQFATIVLISGGNDGIEDGKTGTYGNVQLYVRKGGVDLTAPIDRYHPEIANPADQAPDELSCLELVVVGAPQLLFANLAVASSMCNTLLHLMLRRDEKQLYDEVAIDILQAVSAPLRLSRSGEPTLSAPRLS